MGYTKRILRDWYMPNCGKKKKSKLMFSWQNYPKMQRTFKLIFFKRLKKLLKIDQKHTFKVEFGLIKKKINPVLCK